MAKIGKDESGKYVFVQEGQESNYTNVHEVGSGPAFERAVQMVGSSVPAEEIFMRGQIASRQKELRMRRQVERDNTLQDKV